MVAHREITESPVGLDRLQRGGHEIEAFGPWRTGDPGQARLEIVLTPRQHRSPNEGQGSSGREQPGSEASACLRFNPVPGVERVVEELLRVTRSVAVVGAGHCVKRLRSLVRYPPQLRHNGSF